MILQCTIPPHTESPIGRYNLHMVETHVKCVLSHPYNDVTNLVYLQSEYKEPVQL